MELDSKFNSIFFSDVLYSFQFDVTTGYITEDIVDKRGISILSKLELPTPCLFDDFIKCFLSDKGKMSYAFDSAFRGISTSALMNAYESGKRKIEANLYYEETSTYVRSTFLLSLDDDCHIQCMVINQDNSDTENYKYHMNKNISMNIEKNEGSDLYKSILEHQNCGVLVYTLPEHKILHINEEGLRIYGWDNVNEAQKNLFFIYDNISYPDETIKKRLKEMRKTHESVAYEFVLNKDTKDEKHVFAYSKILLDTNGKAIVMTSFIDKVDWKIQ